MSNALLKNTRFRSEVNSFFRKNSDVLLDIMLFGSTMRGKDNPNDLDLLILHKGDADLDLSYELKKKLKQFGFDAEITDKAYRELFNGAFKAREAILSEGYSLVYDSFVSNGLGYMNLILFRYDIKELSKSDRMRFYYSLYGRTADQKGILKETEAIKFSERVILCPVKNAERIKEYLEKWKIKFLEFPILIPDRLKSIL